MLAGTGIRCPRVDRSLCVRVDRSVCVDRYQELLSEHDRLQRECDRLKNQLSEAHQVAMFQVRLVSQVVGRC